MKIISFALSGSRLIVVAAVLLAAAITMFPSSATAAVVVVPENATEVERFAANELAGELGKCLGGKLDVIAETDEKCGTSPARLYVGATKAAKAARGGRAWETDGVFLKSIDGGVVLDGDPARAPIYAVDVYLEKYCGVRWWTSDASRHPKLDAAPVEGVDLEYAPQFKYRETYYLDGFDPLFKVRSKGNFTSRTRYLLSEIKFVPPEMGGNHRLYFFKGRHSAYHSFFEILPPKVYFEKHPEWYSFVDGKREARQLCLANEEMKAEYIRETLRRLSEDSSVDFIQVSQNDHGGYCECEKCRAMMDEDGGVPSGPYLRFANAVAEAVEKDFPNVHIDTFAYQFTRKAPTKTRPRHNVVVRLCDIECDFARPLTSPLPPREAKFVKDLADWKRIAGGNLFLWDYLANFQGYMLPHPNISVMAPNIRLFAANGAVGVFEQGDALCSAGSFATLRRGLVLFGLFFMVSIGPTLGVAASFGRQAYADRFTYVPMMAFSLLAVWVCTRLPKSVLRPVKTRVAGVVVLLAITAACAVASARYATTFKDELTVSRHVLSVDELNADAMRVVGGAILLEQDDVDTAISYFRNAIAVDPQHQAGLDLIFALRKRGRAEDLAEVEGLTQQFKDDPTVDDHGLVIDMLAEDALKKGDEKEARRYFEAMARVDNPVFAAKAQAWLKSHSAR